MAKKQNKLLSPQKIERILPHRNEMHVEKKDASVDLQHCEVWIHIVQKNSGL